MNINHWYIVFLLVAILVCSGLIVAAQSAEKVFQSNTYNLQENEIWSPPNAEWMDVPVFAPGAKMKVIHGDPATGPSDLYIRFPAEYGVQWHFHTPVEQVFMQSGTMEIEIRESGQEATLGAGGYFLAPSRSIHRATCKGPTECYFFLHASGPFDINVVDENGKVIKSGPETVSGSK